MFNDLIKRDYLLSSFSNSLSLVVITSAHRTLNSNTKKLRLLIYKYEDRVYFATLLLLSNFDGLYYKNYFND